VKDNSSLKSAQNDLNELRAKYDALRGVEAQLKRTTAMLAERDRDVDILREEIRRGEAIKVDLANDFERSEKERKKIEEDLNNNIVQLKEELLVANEQIKQNQAHAEGKQKVLTFLEISQTDGHAWLKMVRILSRALST